MRGVLIFVFYLVVFTILDVRARTFQVLPGIVAWYPPDGLSIAFLLTFGTLFLPAFTIASILSSLFIFRFSLPLSGILGWAIFLALAYGLAVQFLRRGVHMDTQLRRPRDLFWLIVSTASVATGLAILSVSVITASGAVPRMEQPWATVQWWIGEMIGILVIVPALLIHIMPYVKRFAQGEEIRWALSFPRPSRAVIAQALSIIVIMYIIFDVRWPNDFHPYFLIALPLIWIAIQHGIAGASLGILVVNFAFMSGVEWHDFIPAELGPLQLLLFVINLTSLFIGIIVSEHQQVLRATSTEVTRKRTRVIYELIIVCMIALVTWILEHSFDFFEAVTDWERRYQIRGLDETLVTISVLGGVLAVFSYRRWKEMEAETRRREKAQAELQNLYHDLETRVQERTADLSKANESLQAEIAERRQAERALQESEQRFRLLFATSPDAILLIDPHDPSTSWPIVDCNEVACQINGYQREELIGQSVNILNITEGTNEERRIYLDRLRHEGVLRIETFHVHKDGHVFPVEVSTSIFAFEGRELVLGIDRDITERRQAELALKEAESKFRILVEQLPAVTYIVHYGDITNPIYVSPQIETLFGFSPQEWLSDPDLWTNQMHPEDRDRVLAEFAHLDELGQPIDLDYRVVTRDGRVRWIHDQSVLIRDEFGNPRYGHGLIFDITQRKQIEESLEHSERRLRALIENSQEEISLITVDGTLIYESPTTRRTLGYPEGSFIGLNLFELFHPEDRDSAIKTLEQVIREPDGHQEALFRVRHQDGSWRWLEGNVHNLLHEPAIQAIVINYRDVTERKLAEEQLQARNEELSTLFELSRTLADANDVDAVLDLINRRTVESLHTTFARIALKEGDELVTLSAYPIRVLNHDLFAGRRMPITSMPYTQHVMAQGEPVILQRSTSAVSDEERAALLLDFAQTICLIPLRVHDFNSNSNIILGVLMVGEIRNEEREPFAREKLRLARSIGEQAAIAIENTRLFNDLQRSNLELIHAYDATITGWSAALDLRDKETEGHTQRVTEMTLRLAEQMEFSSDELMQIRRGALLHDIGKMGVPDRILLKPDKLTDEEWTIMRMHPTYALQMLKPITYLRLALDIPYCHHEKWDGTGYPRGLKNVQIPLAARIFSIVDVYDALMSDRPYRAGWSKEKTLQHIRELSGSHFDPTVVEMFLKMMTEKNQEEKSLT